MFTCNTIPEDLLERQEIAAASLLQKLCHFPDLWISQLKTA